MPFSAINLSQGVEKIAELSGANRKAVEALLLESDRGREVFELSFSKISEITDSVASIQHLIGAIAETQDPIARTLDVIGDFTNGFRGNFGDSGIGRFLKRFKQVVVPDVKEKLPRHRLRKVAIFLLD